MFLDQAIITLLKRITTEGRKKREKMENLLVCVCAHVFMKTQSESASKSLKSSTLFIWISWNYYEKERESERNRVKIPIQSSYIPGEYHQNSVQIQIAARIALKHTRTHTHVIIVGALNSSNKYIRTKPHQTHNYSHWNSSKAAQMIRGRRSSTG